MTRDRIFQFNVSTSEFISSFIRYIAEYPATFLHFIEKEKLISIVFRLVLRIMLNNSGEILRSILPLSRMYSHRGRLFREVISF